MSNMYETIEVCKDHLRKNIVEISQKLDPSLKVTIYPSISRTYELYFTKDGKEYKPSKAFVNDFLNERKNYCDGEEFKSQFHIYNGRIYVSYPRHENNGKPAPFSEEKVFQDSLDRARYFNNAAGVSSIEGINSFIEKYGDIDFVQVCEMKMQMQMSKIIEMISSRNIKVITVSGPSCSGKTTTANKIRVGLMALGYKPLRISLDDYYLKPENCPKNLDGTRDLECLEALDIKELQLEIASLLSGKKTKLRTFNFKTKEICFEREETWDPSQPIIIEGIHALNKKLLANIDPSILFRVYISPHPQVIVNDSFVFPFSDVRLLRRLIRDKHSRSTSFEESLGMWDKVRDEEFITIYSGEENADYVFDSFYPYELNAMNQLVVPQLKQIPKDSPSYDHVQRLIKNLKDLKTIDLTRIPVNSTIREFIGGGSYKG